MSEQADHIAQKGDVHELHDKYTPQLEGNTTINDAAKTYSKRNYRNTKGSKLHSTAHADDEAATHNRLTHLEQDSHRERVITLVAN